MVVLWVIFEDFWLFSVLESTDELVDSASEVLPPLLIGNEPITKSVLASSLHTERVPVHQWSRHARYISELCLHLLAQLDIELPSPQESK